MAVAKSIGDEEGFELCRDERCGKQALHPAHDLEAERNQIRCPLCTGRLVPMPKQRARCVNCEWRGPKKEAVKDA